MICGTPRDANSLSPVPSAARPSRTARNMLLSFIGPAKLLSRGTEYQIHLVIPIRVEDDSSTSVMVWLDRTRQSVMRHTKQDISPQRHEAHKGDGDTIISLLRDLRAFVVKYSVANTQLNGLCRSIGT